MLHAYVFLCVDFIFIGPISYCVINIRLYPRNLVFSTVDDNISKGIYKKLYPIANTRSKRRHFAVQQVFYKKNINWKF